MSAMEQLGLEGGEEEDSGNDEGDVPDDETATDTSEDGPGVEHKYADALLQYQQEKEKRKQAGGKKAKKARRHEEERLWEEEQMLLVSESVSEYVYEGGGVLCGWTRTYRCVLRGVWGMV